MHWHHEPTPNPSQEGNFRGADESQFPSWEGSVVGRFMESLLGLMITHWDHEPRPGGRWSASVLDCGSPLPLLGPCTRFESARGLAHSKTWRRGVRFMKRGTELAGGHWGDGTLNFPIKAQDSGRRGKTVARWRHMAPNSAPSP